MTRCCFWSTSISTASRTTARRTRFRLHHSRLARPAWCGTGSDPSVITYGALVHRAEVAAAEFEREGISLEIIDLRTLSPYDWEAIAVTVSKTNRVLVVYEDMLSWGYGAEIAARIGEELFEELDAPVKRIAAMDTFCAYQPKLEDEILPQSKDIVAAARELTSY